ncbi:hypothetical protein QYE76_062119 [Lolium multiflorum]|uniref:Arabidopsis retrotransposon Orf1 C-terminal domain-containing protein n=1 Tax=Lolium multiflorum TaxID=4521 RepID=A0AAD8W7V3_LOLMU|nr:hypothetical protein QYE76_062119 [Lolium multiflorum]
MTPREHALLAGMTAAYRVSNDLNTHERDEHKEPLAHCAAQAALPVEDTPASLGIEFEDRHHLNRFNLLKDREIKSRKWACPHILNKLGLRNDFSTLCNNVGLLDFCLEEATTYRRLTLEFLSTLKHTVNHYYNTEENQPRVDRISFRLMNHKYDLTLDEWCNHFGFENSATAYRYASFTLKPSPSMYFSRMRVASTLPRRNSIKCHVIRYLYYAIANTLQARGDFTRLDEEDMMILAKVEANLPPQQDEPEEQEEVEQGPEQEQQSVHDFTTYQDMYALEGSIENLSNLAIKLRDHTTELNSSSLIGAANGTMGIILTTMSSSRGLAKA